MVFVRSRFSLLSLPVHDNEDEEDGDELVRATFLVVAMPALLDTGRKDGADLGFDDVAPGTRRHNSSAWSHSLHVSC